MKLNTLEKKKRRAKQSKRQILLNQIQELIGQNYDDFEIQQKLGLNPERLQKYKRHIFESFRANLESLTAEAVFTDYAIKIDEVVRELNESIALCREKNQLHVMVNAIWRKKEAFDSVIHLAQDLGFVPKNAKELKITNEFSFNAMTTEEVRTEIEREKKRLHALATKKTYIRAEVAEFMDPAVIASLPPNVVILGAKEIEAKKKKSKIIQRRKE